MQPKKYKYEIGVGDLDYDSKFDIEYYRMYLFINYFLRLVSLLSCILVIWMLSKCQYILSAELLIVIAASFIYVRTEILQKSLDLHRRLKKVPRIIKENSKTFYGDEWREPAIECFESHIPGDCALCGAD